MKRRAFTLLELLVVMAIMGMMAVMSVGGYRAMRRGMQERAVGENVDKFLRAAHQRAQIDRQPVAVYLWNETLQVARDNADGVAIVVGKAVAVRYAGRLTRVVGNNLYDEFGDFRFQNEEDDDDEDSSDGRGGALAMIMTKTEIMACICITLMVAVP